MSGPAAEIVISFGHNRGPRQGALSRELHAAMSLARLRASQGCSADATNLPQPVYDRFTEGFDAADLIAAKRLLDEMNDVRRE
jgi:predicted ATPase